MGGYEIPLGRSVREIVTPVRAADLRGAAHVRLARACDWWAAGAVCCALHAFGIFARERA
jgi:hypothetical protein